MPGTWTTQVAPDGVITKMYFKEGQTEPRFTVRMPPEREGSMRPKARLAGARELEATPKPKRDLKPILGILATPLVLMARLVGFVISSVLIAIARGVAFVVCTAWNLAMFAISAFVVLMILTVIVLAYIGFF